MEGISLLPAIQGRPLNRKNPLFWEHESNRAIRDGKRKLVSRKINRGNFTTRKRTAREMHNLAASKPERVNARPRKGSVAARANVLPLGSWREKPANKTDAKSHLLRPGRPPVAGVISLAPLPRPGPTFCSSSVTMSVTLGHRLFWQRDPDAHLDALAANGVRFHPVLQHGPVLSHARQPVDGVVSPPTGWDT
jgi:hypothetical protein